ncbi:MAG: two-component system nitrogen regulation sensor histidine kinase GlnL [Bacteroidia bacterium]|jgi:two-component system nitrogen regulation sensor histidine kinase GlnL
MTPEQGILDNISTSIVSMDNDLKVTGLNAAGEVLLETSAARCIGQHAGKLVLDNQEWLHILEQVLADSSPHASRSFSLSLPSGQHILVDAIVSPMRRENRISGLLVELTTVDLMLKISRNENMINSQETTRAVIRGLAHEIKNPLGGVRGAAQLLARELPDESLAEYTNVIIREADRLRDLVDQLLGPRQQLEKGLFNIHEVLEHVSNLIAAESDNTVKVIRDYDPSLPDFLFDKAQLIQAVLNIMRNSLQASTNVEDCTIILRSRAQRHMTVGTQQHRLGCCIDIIDNGPGVPVEIKHAIFAPMVTGRAEGTGLGLSISQTIINRHGGLLECESTPGETRFSFYLPMEINHA